MGIYVDSADPAEVGRAAALGVVRGVTTNPALIAAAGGPRDELLSALIEAAPTRLFVQLTAETPEAREAEARSLLARSPKIALKIPATTANLALAARLCREGAEVGVTAIFDPAQALIACEAGARYLLPYVNRATRLQGDGLALVRALRQVISAAGAPAEIIAASLKSPAEAVAAALAGAHHLTLPPDLLARMGDHPLSEAAIAEFARAAGRP